jgi:hypothetical protein
MSADNLNPIQLADDLYWKYSEMDLDNKEVVKCCSYTLKMMKSVAANKELHLYLDLAQIHVKNKGK